jgi:transposase
MDDDVDSLRDDQWEKLKGMMPGGTRGKRGPRTDNRKFVNALLWMARSGARWRDLPERFGNFQTVKRRYYDWVRRGDLDKIMTALIETADMEWLMIDSTVIRAHQHAAGAPKKRGDLMLRALAGQKAA